MTVVHWEWFRYCAAPFVVAAAPAGDELFVAALEAPEGGFDVFWLHPASTRPAARANNGISFFIGDDDYDLTVRLLTTLLTPSTPLVMSSALDFWSEVLTNPFNCTVPRNASTVTSSNL